MVDSLDKIVSLAKRRGFVFQSSDIYGGFASCYDYGPLGVELKKNIKEVWWQDMVREHRDIVGLDASIMMNPDVWKASGHLGKGFADVLVECEECHQRFKEDDIGDKCPECGGELMEPRKFNILMKTFVGPVEDEASTVYLRGETCQGIFVNFKNVLDSTRSKVPFGIAQIGKAFRNEISPGQFICRTREFEQMEMQWFCNPEAEKNPEEWFEYWKEKRINWYLNLGIERERLRAREIPEEERAHYAKKQIDLEYKFPFGWEEIEGIHNRGDWDLSTHTKHSEEDLRYYDEEEDKKYFPHVIETSVGIGRSLLAFLCESYHGVEGGRKESSENDKEEVVLKLHEKLSPVKVAVLPLVGNKAKLVEKAKEIFDELKSEFSAQYDDKGSIGRRYRRQDEIGTMAAVTVDFDTLEDDSVTVRERDSMKQIRVNVSNLQQVIKDMLKGKDFSELGNPVG